MIILTLFTHMTLTVRTALAWWLVQDDVIYAVRMLYDCVIGQAR
jgi:hypothetical protein